jgi:hypothetical protein
VQPPRTTARPRRALRAPRTHTTRRHFGFADVLPPVQTLDSARSDDALARGRTFATADDAHAGRGV